MSDETKGPLESLKRRDFLKLVGITTAATAARAARVPPPPTSSIPTSRRPRTSSRASPLLRQHLPRVPGGLRHAWCKHARGPRDQDRGQPGAPGEPGRPVRARPGRRCRGSTTPTAWTHADGSQDDGTWKPITWDEALALLAEQARGRGAAAAALWSPAHETGSLRRAAAQFGGRAPAATHLVLRAVRARGRARGATAARSAPARSRATTSPRATLRDLVRRRLPRDLGLAGRARARLRARMRGDATTAPHSSRSSRGSR